MSEAEGLLDLVSNEWSEFNWEGMPEFQHGNLEPKRSILVHFANEADVAAFAKLVGSTITSRTKFVWYPKLEEGVFSDKVWVASTPLNPTYPVYVISKGRWESRLTVKALEKIHVPYHVVVEPQEHDQYARVIDPAKILTLPFSNLGQGSIPARNWVWEHSVALGAKRHWILDDNIRSFYYYHNNLKCRVGDGTGFAAIEQWVDQYENVAMAGMQYHMFAPRKRGWEHKPVTLNTRVYSCILLDNSIQHRWRGRYNEDTDLSIRILKDGNCTALFYVFLAEKMATMTMKGGNTDQLYVDDGRLKMAESLREQHPDIVHVTTKWGRPQHHVNYEVFKFNRLVPKPGATPPDLSNIMQLKPVEKPGPASAVQQEPVLITIKKPTALAQLTVDPEAPVEVVIATTQLVAAPQPVVEQAPITIGVKPRRFVEIAARPKERWVHPFMVASEATLRGAGGNCLELDEASWNHAATDAVGFDVEVFENFFVACFKRFSDGKRLAIEMSERCELNKDLLRRVLTTNLIVTFNGTHYDVPIVSAALGGADTGRLKDISNQIIRGELKSWDVERTLGVRLPRLNHVDLMEPNPSVRQGLKMLYGRLHGRFLLDLPFNPEAYLTREQMNVVTLYCLNDLDATERVHEAMREPLELRMALSREYKADFRSKSDAQIGEEIVRRRIEAATGRRVRKPTSFSTSTFRYTVPNFVKFSGKKLNEMLAEVQKAEFTVNGLGKVDAPKLLQDLQVPLGEGTYTMGIGGLHSTESHRALRSTPEATLVDVDVASQYPNIILKLGMYPKALGPKFPDVYRKLVSDRLAAKAAGDKTKADSGKIAANGVFGKLSSSHSVLFSPEMFIATTLTGQLSVLMLIERAELCGIPAVSANTDGVVFYCPSQKEGELSELLSEWEEQTGFPVEKTRYSALYSSSVNTYIAISEGGKVKRKGPIADPWSEGDYRGQMSKNPQMTVCSEAVLRLAVSQVPIDETVRACLDPRRFVTVVKADGATWRGNPIGRVARYYWSTDGDPIFVANGSRKVYKTDGARPLLEMGDDVPGDVDYAHYIDEATKLAVDLAVLEPQDSGGLLSRGE